MKYRIEVKVSRSKLTRVWRTYFSVGTDFPRNEAIAKAATLPRNLGRIRIRPTS